MFRDRILMMTLGVSALFHLSMVTLFSVYVWVPVNRPKYAQLEIKYLELSPAANLDMALRMPSLDPPLPESATQLPSSELMLEAPPAAVGPLPEITLYSLDFDQLERTEMIASSLRLRSAFEAEADQNSWAWAIGKIGRLEDRMRDYTPLQSVFKEEANPARSTPIATPAEGIAIYVEWDGEPRDRKLAMGALFNSMWGLDANTTGLPISVPFKVDALGNVVNVLPPLEGDEVLADIGDTLRTFRFAALDDPNAGNQYGTLIIARVAAQ
jgi:hypothetical protein